VSAGCLRPGGGLPRPVDPRRDPVDVRQARIATRIAAHRRGTLVTHKAMVDAAIQVKFPQTSCMRGLVYSRPARKYVTAEGFTSLGMKDIAPVTNSPQSLFLQLTQYATYERFLEEPISPLSLLVSQQRASRLLDLDINTQNDLKSPNPDTQLPRLVHPRNF
jgi:hypothetical protein